MGTSEYNSSVNSARNWHPILGGVEILLVTSCCRNQDKLGGPLGPYADLLKITLDN